MRQDYPVNMMTWSKIETNLVFCQENCTVKSLPSVFGWHKREHRERPHVLAGHPGEAKAGNRRIAASCKNRRVLIWPSAVQLNPRRIPKKTLVLLLVCFLGISYWKSPFRVELSVVFWMSLQKNYRSKPWPILPDHPIPLYRCHRSRMRPFRTVWGRILIKWNFCRLRLVPLYRRESWEMTTMMDAQSRPRLILTQLKGKTNYMIRATNISLFPCLRRMTPAIIVVRTIRHRRLCLVRTCARPEMRAAHITRILSK